MPHTSLPVEPAIEFLKLLDQAARKFTFQTFEDRANKIGEPRPRILHSLRELIHEHALGGGAYVTINETDLTGRKSDNIRRIRAVWQEDDDEFAGTFPLEPSLVVETSPKHRHRYWFPADIWLADEQGRKDFDGVMARMIETYGSDPNAKDLSRVMRLPGFLNRKYEEQCHLVRVVANSGKRYCRNEIIAAFPAPVRKEKEATSSQSHERHRHGDDDEQIRDAIFAINADNRTVWRDVGMALRDHYGDGGRALWDQWSGTSKKYDGREQDKAWRSFDGEGITIGTLFYYAKQAGWRHKRISTSAGGSNKSTDDNKVIELAKLRPLDFGRVRKGEAKKLGVPVTALDDAVKAERRKSAKAAKPALEFDRDELRRSASHIIKHANILDLFGTEFCKVIAGEETNGKLLYLVGTSRLFSKPMNAAIKGTSAGGKSEIRKRLIGFFPLEDVVTFTSLSEKSLIYFDGDFSQKILSMGEATAAEEQSFQDYLLRELMSEACIRYPTVQKVGGELISVVIEKNGPVAFLVTTTKNKLHPENETRMLSLEIDDSETQTRKVLGKVAQVAGMHDMAPVDYKAWQDFQRWLATGERRVVVPFATAMVELIPPVAVRLRRDVGQVIAAIQAHALLHRDQRHRDDAGRIVADIERDYDAVRKLMNAIIAEGSGVAVNPAVTETIEAVTKATISLTEAEGATAKDIAKLLKLDRSAAWRRLLAACDDGYIINLEQRKGMPGKYRAAGQKVEPVAIMPTAADLAERFKTFPSQSPSKIDERATGTK